VHQLVEGQKRKQRRQQRKLTRMLAALAGWLVAAWMMYLIAVSAKTASKIWDPYDILGISRVRFFPLFLCSPFFLPFSPFALSCPFPAFCRQMKHTRRLLFPFLNTRST
jgi:hypothetical protein